MILIPVKAGTGNREFRPLAASWPQKRPPSAACPGTLRARPRGRGPRILFRAALAGRLWALTAVPARPESGSTEPGRPGHGCGDFGRAPAAIEAARWRARRSRPGWQGMQLRESKSQVPAVARARFPPKASSDSPGAAPSVLPRRDPGELPEARPAGAGAMPPVAGASVPVRCALGHLGPRPRLLRDAPRAAPGPR